MELDIKYALAVLIVIAAIGLLFVGIIDFEQCMALIAVGLGLFGVTTAFKLSELNDHLVKRGLV